jgi:hypothetical protein
LIIGNKTVRLNINKWVVENCNINVTDKDCSVKCFKDTTIMLIMTILIILNTGDITDFTFK